MPRIAYPRRPSPARSTTDCRNGLKPRENGIFAEGVTWRQLSVMQLPGMQLSEMMEQAGMAETAGSP